MDHPDVARRFGYARLGLGASLLLAPGLIDRVWVGGVARSRGAKVLGRANGVRDLALGLGLVRALSQGLPARGWLDAGVIVDVGDFAITLLADPELNPTGRWLVLAAAASGAGAGLVLRYWLGRYPAPTAPPPSGSVVPPPWGGSEPGRASEPGPA